MFIVKFIVSLIMNVGIFGGLLFLPAGTLDWWRAWLFLGVVFISTAATLLGVFRSRQDLLDERFKPPIQKGQPLADKIVLLLFITAFLAVVVFIPLDVFRIHIIPKPETFVFVAGDHPFHCGLVDHFVVVRENAFAAPVVKHQVERHQTVIDSGVLGSCGIRCMRALCSS